MYMHMHMYMLCMHMCMYMFVAEVVVNGDETSARPSHEPRSFVIQLGWGCGTFTRTAAALTEVGEVVCEVTMHPHPGFPTLSRLDDVCGACYEAPLPVTTEKMGDSGGDAQIQLLMVSNWRRLAAISAVAVIATAVLCRRRGG